MARLHANMFNVLNDEMIRRLRIVNVNTVFDFVKHDDDKLAKLTRMPSQAVREIKNKIIEDFGGKIKCAKELLIIEENNIISTGLTSLDELLKGGLHPGELYEICGLSSSGKTQLCQSLAINVILKSDGIVHYIDTKRDFSAGRIQMMLDAQGHDDETAARVMHQINITRVTSIHELLTFLYNLSNTLKIVQEKPTKLLIIDSLSSIILTSSETKKGFYLLNHVANVSRFIANEYNIPLLTVNLISEWREFDGFNPNAANKPAIVRPMLGKFWLRVPNTRLVIQKMEKETRKVSVSKSFDLEVGTSCSVDLNDSGFSQIDQVN